MGNTLCTFNVRGRTNRPLQGGPWHRSTSINTSFTVWLSGEDCTFVEVPILGTEGRVTPPPPAPRACIPRPSLDTLAVPGPPGRSCTPWPSLHPLAVPASPGCPWAPWPILQPPGRPCGPYAFLHPLAVPAPRCCLFCPSSVRPRQGLFFMVPLVLPYGLKPPSTHSRRDHVPSDFFRHTCHTQCMRTCCPKSSCS